MYSLQSLFLYVLSKLCVAGDKNQKTEGHCMSVISLKEQAQHEKLTISIVLTLLVLTKSPLGHDYCLTFWLVVKSFQLHFNHSSASHEQKHHNLEFPI